jgi:O-antigen/teichoic acid export membrane protein
MLMIMYILYRSAALTPFTAPLAAAGASVLAIVSIVSRRPFKLWSPWRGDFMRQVAAEHWHYGRWTLLTAIVAWIPACLYYIIVPLLVGLDANGALNALMNLVMPAAQVASASTFLLIPAFGRQRQQRRSASLIWLVFVVMMAGASLYAVLVGVFGGPMMHLLYREQYIEYADFAWLVGLIAVPSAGIATLGSALRAFERPDRVLWAYVTSTAVTCVFGVAAVATWGLLGAILGLLGGYVITMLVMLWWVLRTDAWPDPQAAATLSV